MVTLIHQIIQELKDNKNLASELAEELEDLNAPLSIIAHHRGMASTYKELIASLNNGGISLPEVKRLMNDTKKIMEDFRQNNVPLSLVASQQGHLEAYEHFSKLFPKNRIKLQRVYNYKIVGYSVAA